MQHKADMTTVFELYERKMFGLANAILRDPYAAEDAVIDAFIRLINSGYVLEDPASSATKQLIFRITKSAAIDIYRSKKRDGSLVSEDDALLSDLVAETQDPDIRMEIDHLLSTLPPSMRRVITLRFLKDKSVAETAGILHITEATVRKRQQRAIEKLRKTLERM